VPVVEIKGTGEPEKFVLVHGHYDSWDVGVGDNATGDATLLELARVLWKNRKKLKRSVRIAWWPGHSTGRYAGSTWFADAFAIDLDENCVAQVNCDSPGCRWATMFKDVSWMPETEAYVQSAIKAVTGLASHGERPHRAGDYAFNNIGISSFFMLSSTMPDDLRAEKGYYTVGGCGGNIAWHTENDTLEIADRGIMLRDIKVYLELAGGIADAEILPFDWRAQLDEFVATVDAYQHAAGAGFDLGPAKAACVSLRRALDRLLRGPRSRPRPSRSANAVIQGLARILVPINYTGVPRFRHDPAIPIPPLPTIALAAELERQAPDTVGFAKVQLTRGQNRLVAALRASRAPDRCDRLTRARHVIHYLGLGAPTKRISTPPSCRITRERRKDSPQTGSCRSGSGVSRQAIRQARSRGRSRCKGKKVEVRCAPAVATPRRAASKMRRARHAPSRRNGRRPHAAPPRRERPEGRCCRQR
jgi:hypothetical protein